MAVEVIRDLVWCECMLLVTTPTVREDAWRVCSLKHLQQTFAFKASDATGNTILRNYVDPDSSLCQTSGKLTSDL